MDKAAPTERIIHVEGLSKQYRIWRTPGARLSGPVWQWLSELPLWPDPWRRRWRERADEAHREFHALQDVSFEVRRGESVGIIGRNGAGKSTLLQIITGTLQPSVGSVQVHGRVAALLELGSGFNPEFTGRENVRLNAALHGLNPREVEQRLPSMLAFADIGDFVDQPVKTYSSGMMLRLAFAVVAHLDADVLIIDEALAVGDVFFVQKCMAFLQRFQETGVLLLVSHSAAAITALCQQAVWLDAGRVRRAGSPKEVTEAYLEAFFEEDVRARLSGEAAGIEGQGSGAQKAAAEGAWEMEQAKGGHRGLGEETPTRLATGLVGIQPEGCGTRTEGGKGERFDQRLLCPPPERVWNEIEVFEFDPKAPSFGRKAGLVLDVTLEDEQERALAWIVGGEVVTLKVRFESVEAMRHPIVGFYVKNGLGQQLFGENTFAASRGKTLAAVEGTRFEARFTFQMPILPPGDFVVTVALADGTQADHIMQHWIHDALAFRSVSSPLRAGGLVGLPMREIGLRRLPAVLPVEV